MPSCCQPSPSQTPVVAWGCVIEELSFMRKYSYNTNQTKELLSFFFFSFCSWARRRSSAGHPRQQRKSPHGLRSEGFKWVSLINVSDQKRERLYSGPARLHSDMEVDWRTAIKMATAVFVSDQCTTPVLPWNSHALLKLINRFDWGTGPCSTRHCWNQFNRGDKLSKAHFTQFLAFRICGKLAHYF